MDNFKLTLKQHDESFASDESRSSSDDEGPLYQSQRAVIRQVMKPLIFIEQPSNDFEESSLEVESQSVQSSRQLTPRNRQILIANLRLNVNFT